MATRALEARFERMSVNDENDPGDGSRLYQKTKVGLPSPSPRSWYLPSADDEMSRP